VTSLNVVFVTTFIVTCVFTIVSRNFATACARCESFNARLRDEFLNGQQFDSLFEAKVLLSDWRHEYNHQRTHSALRRQTPARFAETWKFRNQQRLAELVA